MSIETPARTPLSVEAIAARAGRVDREARFPRESVDELAGAGLLGLAVPERFGGAGAGPVEVAEAIVYGALEGTREKTGTDPVVTLKRALDNVKPAIEVKSRRVGGATYQVPIEVKPNRSTTLALRWLVGYAADRREKTMSERLMNEILDASNGLGAAVKKREDTHKMAESNKAFAHYRW